jgi:hypothetical protein
MVGVFGGLLLLGVAGLAMWQGGSEPLGAFIFRIDPPFLNTLQAGVQRNLAPWVWDEVILRIIEQPVWVIPGVLGVILLLSGLPRRRAR